jgi:uncharacterized membrane protein YhhN
MLFLIPYAVAFWIIALISTILKGVREDELVFQRERITRLPKPIFILIKATPALLAVIIVVLFRPSGALFYILLAAALIFCMLGDVGMETVFLAGVGLFLIAQFIYITNFIWHSLLLGFTFLPIVAMVASFLLMILVIVFLTQYIESSETGLGKMKGPLIIYALTVSMTFSSSLLLWLTTASPLGFLPAIGAAFFVFSDFTIGIKEFHHHFNKAELVIFSTYYLAIFLLSLSVFIYSF